MKCSRAGSHPVVGGDLETGSGVPHGGTSLPVPVRSRWRTWRRRWWPRRGPSRAGVAVGVPGDHGACVPETFGDDLDVDLPAGQRERGPGVAEVVQADAGNPGAGHVPVEGLSDAVAVERAAGDLAFAQPPAAAGEDVAARGPAVTQVETIDLLLSSLQAQGVHGLVVDGDDVGAATLEAAQDGHPPPAATVFPEAAPQREGGTLEVHVAPVQTEGFAAAHAGGRQHPPQREVVVVAGDVQEAGELLGAPDHVVLALLLGLRRVGGLARTAGETARRPSWTAAVRHPEMRLCTWRTVVRDRGPSPPGNPRTPDGGRAGSAVRG